MCYDEKWKKNMCVFTAEWNVKGESWQKTYISIDAYGVMDIMERLPVITLDQRINDTDATIWL